MRRKYQSAFTLIELAIVLVIIGLLVGGILSGRELIKSAQVRATVAQINAYATAANTFRNKYNCVPGDCPNATQFGFSDDCTSLGSECGNGAVFGRLNYTATPAYDGYYMESMDFWYQLSAAGLIAGNYPGYDSSLTTLTPGTDVPRLKMDIEAGLFVSGFYTKLIGEGTTQAAASGENYFWIAKSATVVTTNGIYQKGLVIFDNYLLDSKMDDGYPSSGTVRLSFPWQPPGYSPTLWEKAVLNPGPPSRAYGTAGSNSNYCATMDTTPPTYNTINKNVVHSMGGNSTQCMLSIKAGF